MLPSTSRVHFELDQKMWYGGGYYFDCANFCMFVDSDAGWEKANNRRRRMRQSYVRATLGAFRDRRHPVEVVLRELIAHTRSGQPDRAAFVETLVADYSKNHDQGSYIFDIISVIEKSLSARAKPTHKCSISGAECVNPFHCGLQSGSAYTTTLGYQLYWEALQQHPEYFRAREPWKLIGISEEAFKFYQAEAEEKAARELENVDHWVNDATTKKIKHSI